MQPLEEAKLWAPVAVVFAATLLTSLTALLTALSTSVMREQPLVSRDLPTGACPSGSTAVSWLFATPDA